MKYLSIFKWAYSFPYYTLEKDSNKVTICLCAFISLDEIDCTLN